LDPPDDLFGHQPNGQEMNTFTLTRRQNPVLQLTDIPGRMQLFATTNSTVYTNWKTSTDPDARWSGWTEMGGAFDGLAVEKPSVGYLPDGRMQLFVIVASPSPVNRTSIRTAWKVTADANSPWSNWVVLTEQFQLSGRTSVGYLPDRRIQLFVRYIGTTLLTTWKTGTDPNSGWSEVFDFHFDAADDLGPAIGYLPDQRMQLFGYADGTGLRSRWKLTADPNASWSDVEGISDIRQRESRGEPVGIGYLPDNRMQLFIMGFDLGVYTLWKTSPDPNSSWSSVVPMGAQTLETPVVGSRPDGSLQIFIVGTDNDVRTAWKTSDQPNAPWSDWSNLGHPPFDQAGASYHFAPLTVGFLPDNRMQLFWFVSVAPTNDPSARQKIVYSIWQHKTGDGLAWGSWEVMSTLPLGGGGGGGLGNGLTVGYLPPEG